uniref:Immunoglobulin C1-set domain-containing protein n=1 Tax=Phasianus colchicus TaxID=9054 RepID=A0A669QK61_PHACC
VPESGPTLYPLTPYCSHVEGDTNVTIGFLVTSFIPPPVSVTCATVGSPVETTLPVVTSGGYYSLTTAVTLPLEEVCHTELTCRAQHEATGANVRENGP